MDSQNNSPSLNLFWAVCLSTLLAFVLTVIQLPAWLFNYWPDWTALVVAYWALYTPNRFGPFAAFCIGLVLEVLLVRNFAVQGLGLAILAFTVNSTHQQLRVLSIWQQTLLVMVFVGIYKLITGWLFGMITGFTMTSEYGYSLLGCVLAWPFVIILLHELRRMARVR